MGLGKEASKRGNPELAINPYVRRVAYILGACGQQCEYGDTSKMPASQTHLFEELCIDQWQRREWVAAAVGWPLLWAV